MRWRGRNCLVFLLLHLIKYVTEMCSGLTCVSHTGNQRTAQILAQNLQSERGWFCLLSSSCLLCCKLQQGRVVLCISAALLKRSCNKLAALETL